MKRRCDELSELLSAFIDEETSPEEAEIVRAHLRRCRDCTRATMVWHSIATAIDPTRPDPRAQRDLIHAVRRSKVRVAPLLVAVLVTVGAVGGAGTLLLGGRGGTEGNATQLSPSPSLLTSDEASPAPTQSTLDRSPAPSPSKATVNARTHAGVPIRCATKTRATASDIGVTSTRVRIGATVPMDGPAASLWSTAALGMRAAVQQVNEAGGVCGRHVELALRNDSNDSRKGAAFVSDMARNTFALAVMPSDTLRQVIEDGVLARARLPVVGAIGLTDEESDSDWVWSLGTSARTFARIAVRHAYDRGARTFSLVRSLRPPPGARIANEIVHAIASLPGASLVVDIGLDPHAPSYASEVSEYNSRCSPCDATILSLLPDTAQKWLSRRPSAPAVEGSAVPHLFTDNFARACASAAGNDCREFLAWTGLMPPLDRGAQDNEDYIAAVRAMDPTADVRNPIVQAAYMGTIVLMEALGRAGADLTRARLVEVLNAQAYDAGLTAHPLRWAKSRDANRSMLPCAMAVSGGNFVGWRCGRWYDA